MKRAKPAKKRKVSRKTVRRVVAGGLALGGLAYALSVQPTRGAVFSTHATSDPMILDSDLYKMNLSDIMKKYGGNAADVAKMHAKIGRAHV